MSIGDQGQNRVPGGFPDLPVARALTSGNPGDHPLRRHHAGLIIHESMATPPAAEPRATADGAKPARPIVRLLRWLR